MKEPWVQIFVVMALFLIVNSCVVAL